MHLSVHTPRLITITLCAILGMLTTTTPLRAATAPAETPQERDARMAWWRAARFGMFIHWGVYSVPAGTYDGKQIPSLGEWIMHNAKIPVATYAEYAKQFNPTQFDADRWVSIAKNAGMKYIVITAKHHDGFAMFHTHVDGYNIYDATPFHRDPLAELAEACRKQGMKLGFYYSQCQDWHHPGGASLLTPHWDPAQDGDFATYVKTVADPQIKELLTQYGPVSVFWFDTQVKQMTPALARPIVDLLHQYQPQIIWNNRLGGGFAGDTETPEQYIPASGFPGRDWETCMTINDTWGFKSYDTNFKSAQALIRNLADASSKGGNYLLNVGPTSLGVIPQPEVDRLQTVGQWMAVNSDAIYGTSASPFRRALPFGRVTQSGSTLYLIVFDVPKDNRLWLPMTGNITKAFALADPAHALNVVSVDGGEAVEVTPDVKIDPNATVIALQLDGPVKAFLPPIQPGEDGKFDLSALDADSTGHVRLTTHRQSSTLTFRNDDAKATWLLNVTKAGAYALTVKYTTAGAATGSDLTLTATLDGQPLTPADAPTTKPSGKTLTFTATAAEVNKGKASLVVGCDGLPDGGSVTLTEVKLGGVDFLEK